MDSARSASRRARLAGLVVAALVAGLTVGMLATPASAATVSNTINVGQLPQQPKLNSSGTELWVLNNGDNTISVINTITGLVTHTISTGLNNPYDLWFTTDGSKAYVVNASAGTMAVFSTSTYSLATTISLGGSGVNPQGMTIRGGYAYVTRYGDGGVTKINTATNTVTSTFTNIGQGLEGIVISPDGATAYVATSVNTVVAFNTSTGSVTHTVTLGSSGLNLTINATGSIVYLANANGNSVQAINTSTWAVSSVGVGEFPITVTLSPDGNYLYVANEGYNTPGTTVSVINTSTFTATTPITVGTCPFGMAISSDSQTGYVANWCDNTVSVVSGLGGPSAPSAPAAPTVTAGNGSATVSFTAPATGGSAITSYDYSTDSGSTWAALTTTGTTTLTGTITGLTNGTTYQVAVRADNTIGNGAASPATSVTPATVPGAPTAVAATPGNTTATITFAVPGSTGGAAISGYEYSTDGTTWAALTTTGTTTLTGTITGLTNGASYAFSVRALNTAGHSTSAAASASVTPAGAPLPPSGLVVTPGNASATVSFTAAGNGGSAITGYDYSTDNGSTWAALTTTGTTTLTGTITGLANGASYQVKVRADNTIGNGAASAAAAVTPATVPGAPTAVTATPGNSTATITFTVPGSTGGAAITGYEYSTDGTTWTALSSTTTASTVTATVTGLTNGTSYSFSVRALNTAGHSTSATASGPVTPAGPPPAPAAPTVTPGNGSATVSFTAPANGGSAITGYDYSTDNGSTWTPLSTTASGSTLSGTITGLTNGATYPIKVRADNTAGNGGASPATSVTPATVPGAPTAASATAGNATAVITFTVPGSTGGSAITGYTATSTPSGLIASCLSSPCTATGLANGVSYTFTVHAVNGVGASTESAASATVIPQTVPQAPSALVIGTSASTASVTFTVAGNGGSSITGYQASLDGGATWTSFGPVISGASGTGVLTGLVPGAAYTILLRAINANGPGGSSAGAPFTTLPATVSSPSAVAGTASVTVSWPQSSQSNVTGYTVSAEQGLATCSTYSVAATTCLLGAVANTPSTFTVIAHSAAGDSAPSAPTTAVTASSPGVPATAPLDAPTTLTTTDGTLAAVAPSQPVTVVGTGFAAYSTATIIIYSTPIVLATVTTDVSGKFSAPVTVPTGLTVGAHNFVASGVDPSGAIHVMRMPVTISQTTAPAVQAPTHITVTVEGTTATIRFAKPVTTGGAEITGYQASLNTGSTWSPLRTTGAGTLTGKLVGLSIGKTYHVRLRAIAGSTAGAASASIVLTIARAWFKDPISRASRQIEVAMPANPAAYRGALRGTTSTYRSYNGTIAVGVSWVRGHQLVAHQAATLTGEGLFAFDSAAITTAGTAQLKLLAASLRSDKSLICEGYSDYGNKISHQDALSAQRAAAVCAALKSFGVRATMRAVGYGAARPVTVGGTPAQRAANRRVVVYVNG